MRAPSPDGNERLTSSTGLVLLVLLAVETLTTLALGTYLNVHLFRPTAVNWNVATVATVPRGRARGTLR
jgi:hypothetical protein